MITVDGIRPATAADLPAIRRIVADAYGVYVPRIGVEPGPMRADYDALVAAGCVWVAERDEAIAGVLVTREHRDHLLLENVAVEPAAQHRGIGRALIAFAEQQARELALPEVRLYTHAKMTENRALYSRLGYHETGRHDDEGFDRVFFAKRLGD